VAGTLLGLGGIEALTEFGEFLLGVGELTTGFGEGGGDKLGVVGVRGRAAEGGGDVGEGAGAAPEVGLGQRAQPVGGRAEEVAQGDAAVDLLLQLVALFLEIGEAVGVVVFLVKETVGDDGFAALGAAKSPVASGHAIHQGPVHGVVGLQLGMEAGEEAMEFAGVLGGVVREKKVSGEEAVGEAVSRGASLAFRGRGAGGFLGIPAVGEPFQETWSFGHDGFSKLPLREL
jgi:hypothetical protein